MKTPPALLLPLIDLVLVLIFALSGRSSHAEGLTALGLIRTAGPFLMASLAASGAARFLGFEGSTPRNWALCAITTVGLGMLLRVLGGVGGAPLSFVMVSAIFFGSTMGLARILLGWALKRRKGQES